MSVQDPGPAPRRASRRSGPIGAILLAALVLAALVLSGFASWHLLGPRHTPPGQARLVRLYSGNLEVLRSAFNEASGESRLLVLVSPT